MGGAILWSFFAGIYIEQELAMCVVDGWLGWMDGWSLKTLILMTLDSDLR